MSSFEPEVQRVLSVFENHDSEEAAQNLYKSLQEHWGTNAAVTIWMEATNRYDAKYANDNYLELEDDPPEAPEINDDFPMSVEYDGLWGASDFDNDRAAAEHDAYERELFGE